MALKGNQILGLIRRNITYKEKKLIIPVPSSKKALFSTPAKPKTKNVHTVAPCYYAPRYYVDSDITRRSWTLIFCRQVKMPNGSA